MVKFLKVFESPKTKTKLKKEIEKGLILVYTKDSSIANSVYTKMNDSEIKILFSIWSGFDYNLKGKYENEENSGNLGNRFYYKFSSK